MNKIIVLCAIASLMLSSCRCDELESVNEEYTKVKAEKKENKKDVNFEIFNDRHQIGADWRK